MSSKRPYVVVCVPSTGSWKPRMGQDLVHLALRSLQVADISVLREDNSGVSDARNKLVLGALAQSADYTLWCDSDTGAPDDALIRLLSHGRAIVGATFRRRLPPYPKLGQWVDEVVPGYPGLRRAIRLGTGFLLVKTSVYDLVKPPWFYEKFDWEHRSEKNPTGRVSEDHVFVERARGAGIETYVDLELSARMVHIGDNEVPWNLEVAWNLQLTAKQPGPWVRTAVN